MRASARRGRLVGVPPRAGENVQVLDTRGIVPRVTATRSTPFWEVRPDSKHRISEA